MSADLTGAGLSEGNRRVARQRAAAPPCRRRGRRVCGVALGAFLSLAAACILAGPALASNVSWEFPAAGSTIATETVVTPDAEWAVSLEGEELEEAPNVGTVRIEIETPIGGERYEGETIKTVSREASALELQKALEAIKMESDKSKFTLAGDVEVTGGPSGPHEEATLYLVKFKGKLAGHEVGLTAYEEIEIEEEEEVEEAGEEVIGLYAESYELVRGAAHYELVAKNTGSQASSGTITITDTLPTGLVTTETPGGEGWSCLPVGEQAKFSCTSTTAVAAGTDTRPLEIEADTANVKEGEVLVNHAAISGGGGAEATLSDEMFGLARPAATTHAATAITETGATLNALIGPSAGPLLVCEFQYGTTTGYGATAFCPSYEPTAQSVTLQNLKPNTTYHYRIVAVNWDGTGDGADATFTTPPSAAEIAAKKKTEEEAAAKKRGEEEAAAARKKAEEEAAAAKKKAEEAAKQQIGGAAKTGVLGSKEQATATIALAGSTISVTGSHAAVKLTCSGAATCSGKLTLTVKSTSGKGKKKHTRTRMAGSTVFSVPAGKTATVQLALSSIGRALLKAAHGHLGASLTIVKSLPAPAKTQSESVRLQAAKK